MWLQFGAGGETHLTPKLRSEEIKMCKKLFALVTALSLLLCLALPVTAVEGDGLQVIVNDTVVAMDAPVQVWNQTTYVSYWPVVQALYPTATAVWENDRAIVTAPGLRIEIRPGLKYLIANDRYLYLPDGVRTCDSILLVPVRTLAAALGASVSWDATGNSVVLTAGSGPITPGGVAYQEDVVYWLSHIINAESGNQPLEGKIAVGNVVLNRVASSRFPNTVFEVIHQRGQFTPVSNGTIKLTPNEQSIIAAKLCLDGANTVGNALYFINPRYSPNSWASRNRPFVATIGAHAFYA
jgi:N-acetylmuramoyl-L-alanine amidase